MKDLIQKTMQVDLILKDEQASANNLWEFTHAGELKLITGRTTQYYVEDEAAALASFKWSEVKEVRVDGVRILQDGVRTDYRDLLVRSLTNTNKALLQSDALEYGDKLYGMIYGVEQATYQTIIDMCVQARVDLKGAIEALEILKQKRASTV